MCPEPASVRTAIMLQGGGDLGVYEHGVLKAIDVRYGASVQFGASTNEAAISGNGFPAFTATQPVSAARSAACVELP